MNNEPVAWMVDGVLFTSLGAALNISFDIEQPCIPLYTHPVKEQGNPVAWRSQDPDGYWSVYQSPEEGAEPLYTGFKELTDEEIIKVYEDMLGVASAKGSAIDFARAILRKAQNG